MKTQSSFWGNQVLKREDFFLVLLLPEAASTQIQ
jgi:hypothetical protein